MNIAFIFLLLIAIAGVLSGCCLIYLTLKYKEQFEDYKKELLSDFVMTLLPLICLFAVIYMGTH